MASPSPPTTLRPATPADVPIILGFIRELAAYEKLEGIWVEPASATGLAGLANDIANGKLNPKGKRVVAICTGHGMKDPDIITKDMQKPQIVPPRLDALEEIILGD